MRVGKITITYILIELNVLNITSKIFENYEKKTRREE